MAESIGLEVIFQLCATVVLILVIKKYTYKAYLEMMDKRTKTINDSITTAESNKVLSAKELEIVLKEKEEIKAGKKDILNATLKEATVEKEGIIKESKEQARAIISKANEEIEKDKLRIQGELSGEVMDLVSLVAEKFVSERLSKEDEDKMIKDAIAKVSNGK